MGRTKTVTAGSKQEDNKGAADKSCKIKHKTANTDPQLFSTITFQPAKGAVGCTTSIGKKRRCVNHTIFFYVMNRCDEALSVAVVIGGGDKIYGSSWLQKVMDDMVQEEDNLFPIPFFPDTLYLCHRNGDKRLNDEG